MKRRAPSMKLTPNTVRLRRVGFEADETDARQAVGGPSYPAVRCSIHPTGSETTPEHERQQGIEYLDVKMYQEPGLRIRDELVDDRGRVLAVVGVQGSSGGAGGSWVIHCEHLPEPGDG